MSRPCRLPRGKHHPELVLVSVLLVVACSKTESAAPAPKETATAAAGFDIEGFCEKAMGVGRACEGDDELMEGNKVGLCATTLRAARDDEQVKLDDAIAEKCLAEVAGAKPPLPDIRTLKTLAERFESCRAFTKQVPSLRLVTAVAVGTNKAGEGCQTTADCAHGHYCPAAGTDGKPGCLPQQEAGAPCRGNEECVGRCSRDDGNRCVSYCGSK